MTIHRISFRWQVIALIFLACLFIGLVLWRLSFTPEWVVLTGKETARQDICRSVYKKSPARAAWSLRRLLRDRSPAVQVTAVGALDLVSELHESMSPIVIELTRADSARVRARALEFLFQHEGMSKDKWTALAFADLRDEQFRHEHPELLSAYLDTTLEAGNTDVVEWVLELLEKGDVSDGLMGTLSRYPELFRPYRERLVTCLGKPGAAQKALLVSILSAVDGQMRGLRAEDWNNAGTETARLDSEADTSDRFTIEAEWAHRLEPNFQIDVQQGEACISLGEGAGGAHFWRKHEYSSVDIGRAFYMFQVPKDGLYQVWCRCWFMDKCGNHSLLHIDDRWLRWRDAGHDDRYDLLQTWHWKALESQVRLTKGKHTLRLTAGDDGLLYDKLAILPVGQAFDPENPPPMSPLYDAAVPAAVSISMETQAQSRGTQQVISAWVRRTNAECRQGTLTVTVPSPFRLVGEATRPIVFRLDCPVAGADYRVLLPKDSPCGEVEITALFRENGKDRAMGSAILGANYDWLSTGPINADDRRCEKLKREIPVSPADLVGWHTFPQQGYDRYRRLDFEMAYGQQHHVIVFLYTEISVAEAGEYQSFLNLDDCGFVYIDGKQVAGRHKPGVGEGWLLVDRIHLEKGTFPVFAWVYQQPFSDPSGLDAGRHTPNHWNFKWLLRKSQHEPAPQIQGIPVTLPE